MTDTVVAPIPKFKFFDADGKPLAGGLVFTYEAGSTTKAVTYNDADGDSPNTNPVVLDAAGECDLRGDPDITYDITLAPANDTDPPSNAYWTAPGVTSSTTETSPPKPTFYDLDGNVLANGQLFTYSAGTTNKKATFTDAGGMAENDNPVILDTAGQATIRLDATELYKFTLSPETDTDPPTNAFWVEDNAGWDTTNNPVPTTTPWVGTIAANTAGPPGTEPPPAPPSPGFSIPNIKKKSSCTCFSAVYKFAVYDTEADAMNFADWSGTILHTIAHKRPLGFVCNRLFVENTLTNDIEVYDTALNIISTFTPPVGIVVEGGVTTNSSKGLFCLQEQDIYYQAVILDTAGNIINTLSPANIPNIIGPAGVIKKDNYIYMSRNDTADEVEANYLPTGIEGPTAAPQADYVAAYGTIAVNNKFVLAASVGPQSGNPTLQLDVFDLVLNFQRRIELVPYNSDNADMRCVAVMDDKDLFTIIGVNSVATGKWTYTAKHFSLPSFSSVSATVPLNSVGPTDSTLWFNARLVCPFYG